MTMVVAGVKFKIMPEGADIDLEALKSKVEEKIKSFEGAVFNGIEEEPIAFGLKALILTFAYPESSEVDLVQNSLTEMEEISSAEMIDYRRAVG